MNKKYYLCENKDTYKIIMSDESEEVDVRDSNGARLNNGDSVQVIKDLDVKGASATLKRGTVIKNIRLTSNDEEIECRTDKIKNLVLKTRFLKKI